MVGVVWMWFPASRMRPVGLVWVCRLYCPRNNPPHSPGQWEFSPSPSQSQHCATNSVMCIYSWVARTPNHTHILNLHSPHLLCSNPLPSNLFYSNLFHYIQFNSIPLYSALFQIILLSSDLLRCVLFRSLLLSSMLFPSLLFSSLSLLFSSLLLSSVHYYSLHLHSNKSDSFHSHSITLSILLTLFPRCATVPTRVSHPHH